MVLLQGENIIFREGKGRMCKVLGNRSQLNQFLLISKSSNSCLHCFSLDVFGLVIISYFSNLVMSHWFYLLLNIFLLIPHPF